MTDSHLQELERAWQASRAVEDEAAYLRERVRVGELSELRLRLAAHCGNPAAAAILGGAQPPGAFAPWFAELMRLDRTSGLFAAAELAEALLPRWTQEDPRDPAPIEALDAVRRALDSGDGTGLGAHADACCDAKEHTKWNGGPGSLIADLLEALSEALQHPTGDLSHLLESVEELAELLPIDDLGARVHTALCERVLR